MKAHWIAAIGILTVLGAAQSLAQVEIILLEERFDNGLAGGWIADGLWHHTTACEEPVGGAVPGWMYFGIDESCNFDNGEPASGYLASPRLCLPAGAERVTLTYRSRYVGEAGQSEIDGRDWAWCGTYPERLDDVSGDGDRDDWEVRTVDFTEAVDGYLYLRIYWQFDSRDAASNGELGWLIDDVRLTVEFGGDNRIDNLVSGERFGDLWSAVANAAPGDELVVFPGDYAEGVVIDKDILVRSLDPNDDAVVQATHIYGTGDSVVISRGTLRGFRVTKPFGCESATAAIVAGGDAVVERCLVTDVDQIEVRPVVLSGAAIFRWNVVEDINNIAGGGFAVTASDDARVSNNRIANNIMQAGALSIGDNVVACGNLIVNNRGDNSPGGVAARGNSLLLSNFIHNSTTGAGHSGVSARERASVLYNTITRNGTPFSTGGLLATDDVRVRGNIIFNNNGIGDRGISGDAVDIDYNCVFGNRCSSGDSCPDYGESSIEPGPHDIQVNPRLSISDGSDGYTLLADSPCINAGDPNYFAAAGEVDISGNPRVRFGRVDIGASEVQQLLCNDACRTPTGEADVTGDCRVDLSDLARVLSRFGTTAGAEHADGDTDFDGDIDNDDLVNVLSRFGTDCLR